MVSCTLTKPPYAGDYPTENIRSLWAFCAVNMSRAAPGMPQFILYERCDCILDELRKSVKFSELETADSPALSNPSFQRSKSP